jgi:type VI secretion system protein VasD
MTYGLASRLAVLALGCVAVLTTVTLEAKETKLRSEVSAAENVNPNRRGTPQPVKLYIFYLAADEGFLQASFGELTGAEVPALGKDLVRRSEVLVGPGEVAALDETFDEAAKFIGVVAAFTNIDEAVWRGIQEVPRRKWTDVVRLFSKNKLEIKIEGTTVSSAIVRE